MTDATKYKVVLSPPTDSDPPTNALATWDGLIGINQPFAVITDLPTPYNYGAVGDGVADDTVAMQTWLDAIAGSAGFMRAGNFVVSGTLIISGNTTIYGAGSGAAIIAKMAGFPPSQPLLQNKNVLAAPASAVDGNIFIYNICIQGSQTDQCSANLINMGGVFNVMFRDCILRFHINAETANSYICAMSNATDVWFVTNVFYGYGLLSATGPNGGGATWMGPDTKRIHFLHNNFRDGTLPIAIYGSYNEVSGNTLTNSRESGIFGSPSFSQITNNRITSVVRQNTSGNGMELSGQSVLVSGNVIDSTDGASIEIIDGVLYTITGNICRASWLVPPAGPVVGGAITLVSIAGGPAGPAGYNLVTNNICSLGPVLIPSGILFANYGSTAMNNVLCEGNMLAGTPWINSAIQTYPDYVTVAGTNFMIRNNVGASDADYSTQTLNFLIPSGTSGSFQVLSVGFKPSWIQFQAVLAVTGTCALSMGQQSWETGWNITSQTITTARTYFEATGIFWATDGTDCASGDTAGRTSITIRDQLGHPICMAGVTAVNDDGFTLTINESIAADIHTAGTGYATGDTGTINGGNADATYVIAAQSGGVPSAITINAGTGYTNGTNVATTVGGSQPGSGSGLTVDVFVGSPTTEDVVVNAICHA